MNKSWIYIGLIWIAFTTQLNAQQHPFYSQYMVDKFLVNPAVAGANGITKVNFVSRQQYVGLENAPQTFALTMQSRLLDDSYILRRLKLRKKDTKKSRSGRVGLGGSIFTDRNGIMHRTGFQGTYAYHINFNNQWQLSMGLSFSGYQFRINDRDAFITDPDDPLLQYNKKSFFVPDASAGVLATTGLVYAGITVTDLLGSGLKLGEDIFDNYKTLRKVNLLAGIKWDLNQDLELEPSVLLQGTRTNFALDINARLIYMENYWAGLSYRSNNTTVVMVGGRFDIFYLGYAYDIDMGMVRSYSAGSHEVVFGLRLGTNDTRRIRWFRQDQRNFEL